MNSSRITFAAALVLAAMQIPVYASTVLYITGRIVEDPCDISPSSRTISVTCPQPSKIDTRQVSYSEALNGSVAIRDRATMTMKYINPEKSLAILQVDYR